MYVCMLRVKVCVYVCVCMYVCMWSNGEDVCKGAVESEGVCVCMCVCVLDDVCAFVIMAGQIQD